MAKSNDWLPSRRDEILAMGDEMDMASLALNVPDLIPTVKLSMVKME